MLLISLVLSIAYSCEFREEDHYYNLTSLHRKEGYTVKVAADSSFFKMAYQFNFCDDHPRHCQNTAGAYEMIEVLGLLTDSCEFIGKPDESLKTPIENGLQISYLQGSTCENNQKRLTNFKIYCSSQSDSNFKLESQDKCTTNFSIRSPAGCQINIEKPNYTIIYLVVAGIIILGISAFVTIKQIKKKKNELEAPEYVNQQKLNEQQPSDQRKEEVAKQQNNEEVPIQINNEEQA